MKLEGLCWNGSIQVIFAISCAHLCNKLSCNVLGTKKKIKSNSEQDWAKMSMHI